MEEVDVCNLTDQQLNIHWLLINALEEHSKPMSVKNISEEIGCSADSVRRSIDRATYLDPRLYEEEGGLYGLDTEIPI